MIFAIAASPYLPVNEQNVHFIAAPGPIDNPLKGWCPYTIAGPLFQPYSMVFLYVPWKELEPAEGVFRFREWEDKAWNSPLAKGKHIVFRVYADYPGKPSGVPDWLIAKGVKMTRYSDYRGGLSPDYNDRRTVIAMTGLIAALGRRYDENPRVAFVQMGLLGFWGEWHTYPRTELFAQPSVQGEILDAAHTAFPDKIVATRYPSGPGGERNWLGYFDDMFPEDTDGPEDWTFLSRMVRSGRTANWRRAFVGGEMAPAQATKWMGSSFVETTTRMKKLHFSWVGPYGPPQQRNPSPEFTSRCSEMVRAMGYQFQLTELRAPKTVHRGAVAKIELAGRNTGVAPFYYRWPVCLALVDAKGRVCETKSLPVDIRTWLPGSFRFSANVSWRVKPATYKLALGIIDPWTGKPSIAFANRLARTEGWTILGNVSVGR